MGTQLNLGMCNEKLGRLASAWAVFKEAESLARRQGQLGKAAFASKHLETLKPKLSYLTVTVLPEAVVTGFVLKLDDVPVGQALWGMKMPLDPGKHRIEASAPGYEAWKSNVQIGPVADSKTLKVVKLKKTRTITPVAPTKPQSHGVTEKGTHAAGASSTNPPETDGGAGSSSQATWGYVSGGVGLVALGLGGVFGAKAMSTWKQHLDHCDNNLCDGKGDELGRDANTYAIVSDVGFGLGAGLLVLGTTLVLTAPSDPPHRESALRVRVSPMLGRRSAAVQVGGAW